MNTSATQGGRRLAPLLIAWAILLMLETLGQVAMKIAGNRTGAFDLDRASIQAALSSPWLWLGLACYISQFMVWMTILEKSALSAAFPISAIAFVAVMAASWLVFGEPMGWEKVLGAAVIVTGILLIGSDAQSALPTQSHQDAQRTSA